MDIVNIDKWDATSPFFDKTWDYEKTKQSTFGTAYPLEFCGSVMYGFDSSISSSRKTMERQGLNKTVTPIQSEPRLISSGEELVLKAGINAPVTEHDGRLLNCLTFRGNTYYFGIEGSRLTAYQYSEFIGDYYTSKFIMKDPRTISTYKKGFCFVTPQSSSKSLLKGEIPSYTVNGRTAMIENHEITDDGSIISESLSERLSYITKETLKISINKQDNPLPIHDGKWLPAIGSQIENSIVAVFRRGNVDTMVTDVNDEYLPYYDRAFKTKLNNPTVLDIRVYDNRTSKTIRNKIDAFDECVYYTDKDLEEATVIVDYISQLMKKAEMDDLQLSSQILNLYTIAKIGSEPNLRTCKFGEKGSLLTVEIDLIAKNKCVVGHKLMNHGSAKTMVACVRPDNEMPIDANGIRADIILEASEVNRMNQGLSHERYLGGVFYQMLERFRGADDPLTLWDEYIELLSHTKSKMYYSYRSIEDDNVKELLIEEMLLTGTMYVHRMDNYIDVGSVVDNITKSKFALDESGFYDPISGEFLGEGYVGVVATYLLNKTSYDSSASGSSYTNGLSVCGLPNNRLNEQAFSVKPTRVHSETSMRIYSRTHSAKGFHENVLALTSLKASESYVSTMLNTGNLPESFVDDEFIHPKVKQLNDLMLFFGSKTKVVHQQESVHTLDESEIESFISTITPRIGVVKDAGYLKHLNEYSPDSAIISNESLKTLCFNKDAHLGDRWSYPETRYSAKEIPDIVGTPAWINYTVETDKIYKYVSNRVMVDDSDLVEPFLNKIGSSVKVEDIIGDYKNDKQNNKDTQW